MIDIGLKGILVLACGVLNALGGYHWLFCRRFIMPVVIGVALAIFSGTWWFFFLPLPAMGTLCIGYSKIGNWFRGVWLLIQAVIIGLGVTYFGHVWGSWFTYGIYVIGALVLGSLYANWEQILGDTITGFYLGSIILFVR